MLMTLTSRDLERISTNNNRLLIRKDIFTQLITKKLIGYLITIKEVKVNVDNQMEYRLDQRIPTTQQGQMITDLMSNKRLSEL